MNSPRRCSARISIVSAPTAAISPRFTVGDGPTDHIAARNALDQHLAHAVVTIEMVATTTESHLRSVARAVEFARRVYGGSTRGAAVKWMILLLGILSNASASVLVKMALMPPRQFPSLSNPAAALGNWPFWLGLALYGAAFLLYAEALARLPLNVVHPVLTTGAVALVTVLSAAVFRETPDGARLAGIFLVICGVFLLTFRAA